MKRIVIALMMLFWWFSGAIAMAQEEPDEIPPLTIDEFTHTLGEQQLGVNLGLFVPLFLIDTNTGATADSNLTVGGIASIRWDIFLDSFMSLGLEIQGAFSFSTNERPLFTAPIVVRYTIYPAIQPVEFPISIGVGIHISRFEESTKFDPIIKIGVGGYWNIDRQWSVGLNAEYLFVPQIYDGPTPPSTDSRIGNFLAIMAGFFYHIR